jgi:dipeptidyl-peptidase-4
LGPNNSAAEELVMKIRAILFPWALCCLLTIGAVTADEKSETKPDRSLLTLDRIFDSGDFGGEGGPNLQWRKRRGGYTTLQDRELVWHDAASDKTETLVPSHHFVPPGGESPLSIESYAFSDDESKLLIFTNSKRVWRTRSRGDYYVLDIAANQLQKLGGDAPPSSLMFATFSPDASQVAFVRANDIYVQDLHDLHVVKLTHDGSKQIINGTFDWVYEEELGLRNGIRWSPDSRQIAYWQINTEGVQEFKLINNTDSLYPQVQSIPYPKVGERNSAAKIGVVHASGGGTRWLDVKGDPREHYLAQMDWAGDSKEIVLQQFNRLQNQNKVLMADAASGKVRTLFTESDAGWVENNNPKLRWLKDHKQLVWLSERDGWQHAYSISRQDGTATPITSGSFDVIHIDAVDEANGWLYYTASPDNATQRYLYRVKLDGSQTERVSPADQPGTHTYNISPDAKVAVHTYSTFDTPPVVQLISLADHKHIRWFAENKKLKETLAELKRPATEFFRVDIGHGVELDAWCIAPPDMDPAKRYPVLFHVYGEPAGQTVLDHWGGKNYLWHLMLAQQGYVVLSVDNRGTPASRGREFRKCVYRQVGILASADQAAAAESLLKKLPWLDPERVAIWGWSGGGSMTLNALLRYPKLYRTGMSVAPVPNQRLYDTIYQERYMGLPGDNAEGYRLGSPITFAKQLEGNLLLVHGTGDDNVHYQGSEALIDELIAYNKQFSMLAYPNRSHGISEGKGTTRHLYGMLTEYLHQKSPPGPRDKK